MGAKSDGTKISFEQGIVANATGMRVAKRGMYGPSFPSGTPINDTISQFPLDELLDGPGIVDYVVGAVPSPGVFVLGTHDHPLQQHYLNLYKLGKGPLYCFYTPYHLCHFEVPFTVARAVLFHDAALTPLGEPRCDVLTVVKQDLKAGDILDGPGGYASYGLLENAEVSKGQNLLPMGVSEGCRVKRNISKDEVLTYADIEVPAGRLCDKLRAEQASHFN